MKPETVETGDMRTADEAHRAGEARAERDDRQRRGDEGDDPPETELAAQTAAIDEIISGGCGHATSPRRPARRALRSRGDAGDRLGEAAN